MLKSYGINDSEIFKIAVIATMSSGKSTFINALMGTEILPSKNQACTAKIVPIINNNSAENFKAYMEYRSGKKDIVALKSNEIVDGFNLNNEISKILIEGNIKAFKNYNKIPVLIDTPGTNYSEDITHKEETYKLLEKLDDGLILYIINATQFGINDDLELMLHIREKVNNSNNKLKILFIVNKIDEFDLQKEDIEQTMDSIYKYIEENGIKNPTLIPISALAAKLFREVIIGKELTRREKRDFKSYYDLFRSKNYSLNRFAYVSSQKRRTIDVAGDNYFEYDLLEAMRNTGIELVENSINEVLIDSCDKCIPKINFKKKLNKRKEESVENSTEQVIKQLLKIYKDNEILKKVKKIKTQASIRKFDQEINKKLKQIYDNAYEESGKIALECIINKCSDHGKIKKIVCTAIDDIEDIIIDNK